MFGDSQTNGMSDAINKYFSGFSINYNNWYGGGYRIAYKDVPDDKVKGKNQGKSIESYMDQYKVGDTVIIGSIGGNLSFSAREKYPIIGPAITSDPYLVDLPEKLPTTQDDTFIPTSLQEAAQLSAGEGAALSIAIKYGLGSLIQDGDNATSFKKFCDILNTIRQKGVNVIIFGLPYGGDEARQEDRVHFDYVQFASLAAEGLGKNYVSVMQDSRGLKAGDGDVHYFTGNGGVGYKTYFEKLLNPSLETFYFLYRKDLQDIVDFYAKSSESPAEPSVIDVQKELISVPEEEKPESGMLDSLGDAFDSLLGGDDEPPVPTTPAVPSSACIGTVAGSGGGGGGGGGPGSASAGKAYGAPTEPFNGGTSGVIVIDGQSYPVDFPVIGDRQYKGQKRKGPPTYLVIHNSAGSGDARGVIDYLATQGYGVHFTIGLDGQIYQHADPVTQIVYQASGLNTDSIGIETPLRIFGPNGEKQSAAGCTIAKEGVWWSKNTAEGGSVYIGKDKQTGEKKYRSVTGFTVPPQVMVDASNKLLAFLASKIPTITPALTTFPKNYPGPAAYKERKNSHGVKMWNKGGSWDYPKPSLSGPYKGSIIAHRDWSSKADGRYFLEKFYEFYTGTKLDGIFRE